jgi:hypothetical protein
MRNLFLALCVFIFPLFSSIAYAATPSRPPISKSPGMDGAGVVSGSGTVTPDLFTGAMSYSIPVEVVPGRKGMQPSLALTYRSNNRDGWVGMGWDLEIGSIERSTKNGVDLVGGTDFVLRMAGTAIDLIYDNSPGVNFYRAKIEGGFYRVEKISSGSLFYWQVTDKTGRKYLFGQTSATRQYDPGDSNKVFKWCLDHVEDTNGNYMTYSYWKDQNQVYLDRIDYTGPYTDPPANYVKFYWGIRSDAPDMFTTNFQVKTAYRLKTIDVWGGGNRVRTHKLEYYDSTKTFRSFLSQVKQFGKDAAVDTYGNITNEATASTLPVRTAQYGNPTLGMNTESMFYEALPFEAYISIDGGDGGVRFVDLNGDGRVDIVRWTYTSPSTGWYGGNGGQMYAALNTGTGWQRAQQYETLPFEAYISIDGGDGGVRFEDLNGDGKVDVVRWTYTSPSTGWYGGSGGQRYVALNTGAGWQRASQYETTLPFQAYISIDGGDGGVRFVDLNGDGKVDIVRWTYTDNGTYGNGGQHYAALNTGTGWQRSSEYEAVPFEAYIGINGKDGGVQFVDLNGDGKVDIERWTYSINGWYGNGAKIGAAVGDSVFELLKSISNGIGGSTTVSYLPSTHHTNTQLPFPVQTLSSITTNDGNGVSATTNFLYSGGFFHIGERDFRGFNYVKVTGPAGPSPNFERNITETWFHQGNDADVMAENATRDYMADLANVTDGYMKGKPYRTKISDAQNKIYLSTTTSYNLEVSSPYYFAPPLQVYTYNCDAGAAVCDSTSYGKLATNVYTYDAYGNVTREDFDGGDSDNSTDRTVTRDYGYNAGKWIVGLPITETVYSGIGTANQTAKTDYYYDGGSDCLSDASSQTPDIGNLTRIVRLFEEKQTGESDPEVWME